MTKRGEVSEKVYDAAMRAATRRLKRCLSAAYTEALMHKTDTPGLSVADVLCYQNDALLRAWNTKP